MACIKAMKYDETDRKLLSFLSNQTFPGKDLFLIELIPRTAFQRNAPHLCLQYNTRLSEMMQNITIMCCNLSKVFPRGISLFDFICVDSV